MVNPFYVQPAQIDIDPLLSGIGSIVKQNRDANRRQQAEAEIMEASQSGDPVRMAEISIKYPEYSAAAKNAFGFTNKASEAAARETYRRVLSDPQNAPQYLQQGIQQVTDARGRPDMMTRDFQMFQENPEQALQAIKMGYARLDPEGYKTLGGGPVNQEILKETRGEIRKQLSGIAKETGVLKSNYSKLKNLAGEIKKGNRQAVPQALVSLVKIGDPGSIVSTNEMNAALNQQNPVSAVFDLLTSKGVSGDVTNSITQRIDPLDPKNVNVDDLLNTATASISAFVPSIQGRFSSAEELASSNLTPQGIQALFSDRLRSDVAGLSELVPGQPQQAQFQEGQTATNPQTGQKVIFTNGEWQPTS